MKPLYAVAIAATVILLETPETRFDLYANWVGWLLMVVAVRTLADEPPYRWNRALWTTLLLALVVDAALWWPEVGDAVDDAETSVGWAVGLPQFAFYALLCHRLATAALAAADRVGSACLTWTAALMVAVMVGPVLVYGAGWNDLEPVVGTLVTLGQLLLIVLCVAFGQRTWAAARAKGGDTVESSRDAGESTLPQRSSARDVTIRLYPVMIRRAPTPAVRRPQRQRCRRRRRAHDPDRTDTTMTTTSIGAPVPVLRVQDWPTAERFYVDYLAFTTAWVHRFEPGLPAYARLVRDGATLDLSEHHGDGTPGSLVWLPVGDVTALHRELTGRGHPRLRPGIDSEAPGGPTMAITDPFGNTLRFCTPDGS